jgi:hypothetical protein
MSESAKLECLGAMMFGTKAGKLEGFEVLKLKGSNQF